VTSRIPISIITVELVDIHRPSIIRETCHWNISKLFSHSGLRSSGMLRGACL
jgi:hypothetical protein